MNGRLAPPGEHPLLETWGKTWNNPKGAAECLFMGAATTGIWYLCQYLLRVPEWAVKQTAWTYFIGVTYVLYIAGTFITALWASASFAFGLAGLSRALVRLCLGVRAPAADNLPARAFTVGLAEFLIKAVFFVLFVWLNYRHAIWALHYIRMAGQPLPK